MTTDNSENFADTWGTFSCRHALLMYSVPGQTVERCAVVGENNRECVGVCFIHCSCIEEYRQLARSTILDTLLSLCIRVTYCCTTENRVHITDILSVGVTATLP